MQKFGSILHPTTSYNPQRYIMNSDYYLKTYKKNGQRNVRSPNDVFGDRDNNDLT